MPELVAQDERGYKTVNYSELPLMLLQAFKELRSEKDVQLAAQQKQIDALQQQSASLDALDRAGAAGDQRHPRVQLATSDAGIACG